MMGSIKTRGGWVVSLLWILTTAILTAVLVTAMRRVPILITTIDTRDPEFLVGIIETLGWLAAIIGLLWLSAILTITIACAGLRRTKITWRAGEALLRRWSPRLLRHLIASALGVGLSAGVVLPAQATAIEHHDTQREQELSSESSSIGWDQQARGFENILNPESQATNDAVVPTEAPEKQKEPQTVLTSTETSRETHQVAPGESLWIIAHDHLEGDPSASKIDSAWRQWYEHNKDVIGSNPHLIRPGMELTAPPEASPTP